MYLFKSAIYASVSDSTIIDSVQFDVTSIVSNRDVSSEGWGETGLLNLVD